MGKRQWETHYFKTLYPTGDRRQWETLKTLYPTGDRRERSKVSNRFVVTGIPEIDKALGDLERKAQRKIVVAAMRRAMKIVQEEAKHNAPVDTGQLKKSIKVRAGKRRRGAITIECRTQDPNFKEKFIEFGTVKMAARPFMRPAYDAKKEPAKKIAIAEILEGIERAADQG